MDVFWAAPPVSRTLAVATLVTSILVHSGLVGGKHVIFYMPWIFKLPPQLWRLFTAFFITGPQLGILFDTYFLYTYGSSLERNSPRFKEPGDFFTYVIFVCSSIITLNVAIFGGLVFTPALVLALAYTYSQDNRGRNVSFFFITIPVQWLPYAILLMTLIMGGPEAALSQASGLLSAHLYDFLTRLWPTFGGGRNYIQTPAIVKRLFGSNTQSVTGRTYGTAFRPPARNQQMAQDSSRGTSTGFGGVSGIWRNRGSGHRLGGD